MKKILSHSRFTNTFPDSSYGSSVVVSARPTSVSENLLDDKELPTGIDSDDKLESEKVIYGRSSTPSPIDNKFSLSNVIVHTNDKNCGDFANERESESVYSPVESYANQNNFYGDYQAADNPNWPYDLSRTSLVAKNRIPSIDYSGQYQNSAQTSDANINFRNPYNSYAGAMKGNLMAMCQFNDYLSPPSSVSSSSGYEISDNNNNSFINYDQAHHQTSVDDVFRDEFKTENCFLVEDASAGNYTTLTNAAASAAPLDMYHLHDYQRNYVHNHSTSSGGDSRSPDGYTNDDYENNMQNFTQLTNMTSRSNGLYASSPNPGVEHNIMYESSPHVLSPTRWVSFFPTSSSNYREF